MNAKNESDRFLKFENLKDENLVKMLNCISDENKKACYEFIGKLQENAEHLINEERILAEQAKNKEILNSITEYQNSYIELRNSLVDDLFDKVLLKIVDYVETSDYSDLLIDSIKNMCEDITDEINLYLCPRDMVFIDRLSDIKNITILEGYDDYIGGYKIISKNNNIVIDNSYKAMLKEAKKTFIMLKLNNNDEIHRENKPL